LGDSLGGVDDAGLALSVGLGVCTSLGGAGDVEVVLDGDDAAADAGLDFCCGALCGSDDDFSDVAPRSRSVLLVADEELPSPEAAVVVAELVDTGASAELELCEGGVCCAADGR